MFLKLQDNYCYVRVQGKDDAEELKLAEKDVEYLEEVSSKVYPLLTRLDSHHKCLAKRDTNKSVEEASDEARQVKVNNTLSNERKFVISFMSLTKADMNAILGI